jgi:hypothetical protein
LKNKKTRASTLGQMRVGELFKIPLSTRDACRKLDYQVGIVGLDLRLVGGLVPYRRAAFFASVDNNVAPFSVRLGLYGTKNAHTAVCPIPGIDVYVQRAKAEGTMISRGVTERKHLLAAILADKSRIILLESFIFHIFLPFPFSVCLSATADTTALKSFFRKSQTLLSDAEF